MKFYSVTPTSVGVHESNCGSNTTSQQNAPDVTTAKTADQRDKKVIQQNTPDMTTAKTVNQRDRK